MDNCLKDTHIQLLRGQISAETQVLKFSNPPSSNKDPQSYQKRHFADMFSLLSLSLNNSSRNLILNRAHLGEFVYSPIYRGYEAEWIFDLESEFLESINNKHSMIKLVLLYDSNNDQLLSREDGKSFSESDQNKLDDERKRFLEAFQRSHFKNKCKIDLSDYSKNIESIGSGRSIDTHKTLDVILG